MVLERFRLDDRVAVVTGAGRGIGAASALALAEAGADVVLAARTESQLKDVATQVERMGRKAVIVAADLSDTDQAAALAQTAADALGRLDVVINNVGGTMPREFERTNVRALEDAFHFNVSTAHALTRAALPHLLASDCAAVVNISSVLSRVSGRGYLAYGTAKAALSHWTRLAARDLAPRVRVNAVAVGSVATSALEIVTGDEGLTAQMEASTPLRRIGEPDDIAATVLFLASAAGAYLTGKVLEVDGGIDQPNLDMGLPDLGEA
ncbi:SDR family oxidoreductase [Aeromicrobium sp. CTD01-1L150]|uniref:SDR family oxidoreductase n=1 Tax=Aeromicrobium sp. CTD01-1L150 TaxID=3341830 RepID=UPI0035C0E625